MTLQIIAPRTQSHTHATLSIYRYGHRDALICHKCAHRQITSAIFVLPADLVSEDRGAAWATDQQATGERGTDRAERRKSRTREGNV